jgi:extradiol dioxygenase family protein
MGGLRLLRPPARRAHSIPTSEHVHHNEVDGHDVPVPHFGVVHGVDAWQRSPNACERGIAFRDRAGIRFAGQVGEQATMFLYDPSGNALEFKAFKDPSRLFAK